VLGAVNPGLWPAATVLTSPRGFLASFTKKNDSSSRSSFYGKSLVRWCHVVAGIVVIGLMYTYVSRPERFHKES
jgi:hypothetical protein